MYALNRQLIEPAAQVDNIVDAVEHVVASAGRLGVDASRVALWGYSLAGGHGAHACSRKRCDSFIIMFSICFGII